MPQNWSLEVHAGTCTCTWLSPGGHSSGGRALTAKSQRSLVQSRVAAGFSQLSKKVFSSLTNVHVHVHWCMNTLRATTS